MVLDWLIWKRKGREPVEATIDRAASANPAVRGFITEDELIRVREYSDRKLAAAENTYSIVEGYNIDLLDMLVWGVERGMNEGNRDHEEALQRGEYKGLIICQRDSVFLMGAIPLVVIDMNELGLFTKFDRTLKQDRDYLVGIITSSYQKYRQNYESQP